MNILCQASRCVKAKCRRLTVKISIWLSSWFGHKTVLLHELNSLTKPSTLCRSSFCYGDASSIYTIYTLFCSARVFFFGTAFTAKAPLQKSDLNDCSPAKATNNALFLSHQFLAYYNYDIDLMIKTC